MIIHLSYCSLHLTNFGIETVFPDGSKCSNWPLSDLAYKIIAERCGVNDFLQYCREHDFSHAFLSEKMFNSVSPVLWYAAHNKKDDLIGLYEERVVYEWQCFVRNTLNKIIIDKNWLEWLSEYRTFVHMMGYEL